MGNCFNRCPEFRIDNRENAWLDIRGSFGPRNAIIGSEVYNSDISEWVPWALLNSADPISDVERFGKWLIWKCTYGTTNYGNLPTRNRNHIGISAIPCPYDSSKYDEIRSELWLGFVPSITSDHGVNYMKVSQRGNVWGFECTYSGCPFSIDNGYQYFNA